MINNLATSETGRVGFSLVVVGRGRFGKQLEGSSSVNNGGIVWYLGDLAREPLRKQLLDTSGRLANRPLASVFLGIWPKA